MNAANVITLPVISPQETARQHDARAASRGNGPIIDVEPVAEYVSSDRASRSYRANADSARRDPSVPARAPRTRAHDQEPASLGFAAQRIAQEELSEGLYFENFKPAIAAYAAADSNFVTVRRPPLSSVVIWA
jgi:hypothetical protein